MEPVLPSGDLASEATFCIPSGRGPRGGDVSKAVRLDAQAALLDDALVGAHRGDNHRTKPLMTIPGVVDEKPWHTMAAYMLIAGRTNSEIAMAAGVGEQMVSTIRSQTWFQQRLASIANNDGEEILAAMKSHALAAVERVAHIAEHGESERNRLSANVILIEQAVGKAVQKNLNLNANAMSGLSPQEEYQRTQEELKALRAARSSGPA